MKGTAVQELKWHLFVPTCQRSARNSDPSRLHQEPVEEEIIEEEEEEENEEEKLTPEEEEKPTPFAANT